MTDPVYHLLFLCTGNSTLLDARREHLGMDGAGRFKTFSAGSLPKGSLNPLA